MLLLSAEALPTLFGSVVNHSVGLRQTSSSLCQRGTAENEQRMGQVSDMLTGRDRTSVQTEEQVSGRLRAGMEFSLMDN